MKNYQVRPGSKLSLSHLDPDDTGDYKKTEQGKEKAKTATKKLIGKLSELQERLYANSNRALLIVLQGMDTSGKDGTIKHVMSGINPQGCKVVTFKTPSQKNSVMISCGAYIKKHLLKAKSVFSTARIMRMC